MKKIALALAAAAAVLLGSAGVADAYPPGGVGVTATPASGPPGYTVTVKANCTAGETVTVKLEAQTATATCAASGTALGANATAAGGTATTTISAPATAGTYTGTVTGSISGALGTFTSTVVVAAATTTAPNPTGGLPATGSNGTSTMTIVAGGLLLAGLGMFGVATARRRQDTAAA